ncbi:MAG: PAS domain S-box protein [Nitrospira sp.]|nr:PAS domain S-box protein [Nitrospira sp.]
MKREPAEALFLTEGARRMSALTASTDRLIEAKQAHITDDIEGSRRKATRLFYAACAILAVATSCGLSFGVMISHHIGGGLQRLEQLTSQLGQGHFSARSGITTADDIGHLAHAFDSMAEKLADSHSLTQAIMDNSPSLIFIKDRDGRYLKINRNFERTLNITTEATLGKTDMDIFPSGQARRFMQYDQEVLQQQEATICDEQYDTDAGRLFTMTQRFPLFDGDGRLCGIGGIATDITSYRQAREHLARTEERLRLSTDAAQIGVWDWDVATGALYWDEQMFAIYGIEKPLFSNAYRDWRNALLPDDVPQTEEDLQAALRNERPFDTSFRIRWRDGSTRHVKAKGQVIFATDGTPIRVIAVNYDITQLKMAENTLREREAYLRAIVDHAITGIIIINDDGIVETFNPAAQQIFGYAPDDVIGRNVKILMPEPYQSEHDRYIENYRRTGIPQIINIGREVVGLRKDGAEFPMDLAVSEVVLYNRVIYIGMVRDITVMKDSEARLEEAAVELECQNIELELAHKQIVAATQAKTAFLAAMSHEIRTPMNAIVGMAEVLNDSELNGHQKEYVQHLSRAADHLLSLLNDILDISKIEAGKITLESIPVDLRDLIETVGELMRLRAHTKNVELIVRIVPGMPREMMGDPTRLRQILVNLVGNALKFTQQGQVVLQAESADPGLIRLSISDTGIGIPADKLQSIFDCFTQADSSTTRQYGGTGLGLNISKQLTTLMEGTITVRSTSGQGSTFTVTLPHRAAPSNPAVDSPSPPSIQGKHILIVDDNEISGLAISEILSEAGATTTRAMAGTQAVARLHMAQCGGTPIHLLIVDRDMPGMDGIQVASAVRQTPDNAALPIIMLTSNPHTEDQQLLKSLHIVHHVIKPVSRAALLETTVAALEQTAAVQCISPVSSPLDNLHSYRILLVEDVAINRDIVALFLKGSAIILDIAENGAIAVKKFQTGGYDLVLMDMQMPVMDGLEATKAIREWERECGNTATPVVMLTANAFTEDIARCQTAGCTDYLTKPIKKDVLLTTIRKHLDHIA